MQNSLTPLSSAVNPAARTPQGALLHQELIRKRRSIKSVSFFIMPCSKCYITVRRRRNEKSRCLSETRADRNYRSWAGFRNSRHLLFQELLTQDRCTEVISTD